MTTVGLRELRQNASDLVRRVEAGEAITITVSGRPAALLQPVSNHSWVQWEALAELFTGPADDAWEADRGRIDDALSDPWAPR